VRVVGVGAGAPAAARGLVTVDGIDGSGKSMLARRLAAALGGRAVLLAVDDFRRPVDFGRGDRPELDLYWDERYDLPALDACAAAFLAGAAGCRVPGFDSVSETVGPGRVVSFADARWLVVEGVFVGRLAQAARAYAVFVDVPRDEAHRRVLARDLKKGRSEAEVRGRIDQRYFPAHDRYLALCQPRDRAWVVLDNHGPPALTPRLVRARAGGPDELWAPVDAALARMTTPDGAPGGGAL
jgi:uridine kinase